MESVLVDWHEWAPWGCVGFAQFGAGGWYNIPKSGTVAWYVGLGVFGGWVVMDPICPVGSCPVPPPLFSPFLKKKKINKKKRVELGIYWEIGSGAMIHPGRHTPPTPYGTEPWEFWVVFGHGSRLDGGSFSDKRGNGSNITSRFALQPAIGNKKPRRSGVLRHYLAIMACVAYSCRPKRPARTFDCDTGVVDAAA